MPRLELAPNENPVGSWLSNTKPKKIMVFSPYERLDRNLKILMERWDIDKGNFLIGFWLRFTERGKPVVTYHPTTSKWIVYKGDITVTYKGGARKFLNWYDKQ